MAQQNEKPKGSGPAAPRDYLDVRSNYRHQDQTTDHYGSYNPVDGRYENRLDDLPVGGNNLGFENEYIERSSGPEDPESQPGRDSGFFGFDGDFGR